MYTIHNEIAPGFPVTEPLPLTYIMDEVEGMEGMILMGALAAFGFLCALWAVAGWLLPGDRGAAMVCLCHPGLKELPAVRRLCWLRDMGLFRGPILLVDCGISAEEQQQLSRLGHGIELCSPEELASRLEQERKRLD